MPKGHNPGLSPQRVAGFFAGYHMVKKITTEQVQLGMYIHKLGGPWMSHPFWRKSFLLDKPADLQRLRASPVTEVWIDPSRGLDVGLNLAAPGQGAAVLSTLVSVADNFPPVSPPEIARAVAICQEARGAVLDMLTEARMGRAIDITLATNVVDQISESVARNPDALVSVARLKTADNYTFMHSVAVSALMVALAKKMDLNETQVQQAGLAGLLHDMGKARTRPEILNKPGKLTDEEFAHMKQHPQDGYQLLKGTLTDEDVLDACLHHHERMDGQGYPHGLPGADIRLLARMTAVCDVYDAITSNRPYKAGWSPPVALQHMASWSRSHFDREIFETFLKTIGIYPVGSMVRLQSGRLAMVFASSNDPNSIASPRVVAFYDTHRQQKLTPPQIIDLAHCTDDRLIGHEDPLSWTFPDITPSEIDAIWQQAAQTST